MVADQFADSPNIPSLQEIEKILRSHHEEELTEKEFNIPLNIDDMLTNFFCNTFKINPTKYITAMYVKRAVKDVEEVLDILNADLDIPHDFDEDLKLDNLDVAILNILYDKMTNKRKTNKDVCKLLPPNLNSLVGLRGLLIKYHANKLDQHETEDIDKYRHRGLNIKSDIVKQLLNLSNDTRTKVDNDHKLFCRRFHSLFKWPAIMTLEGPSSEVQGTSSCSFSPTKIQVERTYSRADKNKAKEFAEKQMSICELPSSSMEAAPLKLTPVTNKSIIEDLMHNRDKKLFCMEAVKSDGETKMVIKEVDFHSCIGATSSNENNTNSTSNHQVRLINSRITETNCYKPSKKKRKLSQFIPGQEDCIVMNTENDDYMSDDADMGDNIADDLKDLNKLEIFLKDQQCKEMSNEGENNFFYLCAK